MRMVTEMIKLVIYVVLLILGFCLLTDSTILYIIIYMYMFRNRDFR